MNFKQALPALQGIPSYVQGKANVLYCGPRTSTWMRAMQDILPGTWFPTLKNAIDALPAGDGTATFGFNNSVIFVGPEHPEVTTSTLPIVPLSKSGVTIVFGPDAYLYTSAILGAGNALLELQGYYSKVVNGRFFTTQAAQTGSAIIVGGSGVEGAGLYATLENCLVQCTESGTYTDFAKGIQVRDGKYTTIKDCVVYGDAGTTANISIEAGIGNSRGVRIINTTSRIVVDAGNAAYALSVDADQNYGHIIGGSFVTPSTQDAIEIDGNGWELGGAGLAANADAVGAGAQIDYNGTGVIVGPFYVKQVGGGTAASLFSEANI
jgi:hypothetical protein